MSFFFSEKIQQLVVNDSMEEKLKNLLEMILSNRYETEVHIELKKGTKNSASEK